MFFIWKIALLNCEVIFKPKSVIFQDLIIKEMIGEGYLKNGLYFLNCNKEGFCAQKNEDLNKFGIRGLGTLPIKFLSLYLNFPK
jgi:hypothetical protein